MCKTHCWAIMHHRGHIVRFNVLDTPGANLPEVPLKARFDIIGVNGHVIVPIRSRVLVVKSDTMCNFMGNGSNLQNPWVLFNKKHKSLNFKKEQSNYIQMNKLSWLVIVNRPIVDSILQSWFPADHLFDQSETDTWKQRCFGVLGDYAFHI